MSPLKTDDTNLAQQAKNMLPDPNYHRAKFTSQECANPGDQTKPQAFHRPQRNLR